MNKLLLSLFMLFVLSGNSWAAILVFSPNGTYTTKTTLAAAVAAADVVGKTIVVTSPITINSITIPETIGFRVEKDGLITVNSGQTLTVTNRDVRAEWFANLATAVKTAAASNSNLIMSGDFAVSTPITVTAGNYLGISGEANAVISSTCADSASAVINITDTSATKLVMKNFTINHTGSGVALSGIKNSDAGSVYLENVAVTGIPYYGLEIIGERVEAINVRATGNVHAGAFYGGSGIISVVGGDYSSNGNGTDNLEGYGLLISGETSTVTGGRFANNDRYGIDLRRANKATLTGVSVYNSGLTGIYGVNEDGEKDSSNISIIGGTVDNNARVGSGRGIWLGAFSTGSTSTAGEISISGVTVKNTLSSGILVAGGSGTFGPERISVINNKLLNCATASAASINIGGGSLLIDSANISDNIIKNSRGIVVNQVKYATINSNQLTDHTGDNKAIDHSAGAILNSIIKNNLVTGTVTASPNIYSAAPSRSISDNITPEAAGSVAHELVGNKTGLVDNTATAFLQVLMPNPSTSSTTATLLIDYTTVDADKRENAITGQLILQIVRYPGAVAVATLANSIAQVSTLAGSGWGVTQTTAFSLAAVSGGATADNYINLTAAINTSDSLTGQITYRARLMSNNSVAQPPMVMYPI